MFGSYTLSFILISLLTEYTLYLESVQIFYYKLLLHPFIYLMYSILIQAYILYALEALIRSNITARQFYAKRAWLLIGTIITRFLITFQLGLYSFIAIPFEHGIGLYILLCQNIFLGSAASILWSYVYRGLKDTMPTIGESRPNLEEDGPQYTSESTIIIKTNLDPSYHIKHLRMHIDKYKELFSIWRNFAMVYDDIASLLANRPISSTFSLHGLLLEGIEGTGKTTLAHTIAYHFGADMFCLGSSTLTSSFIGGTASRIRNVFTEARLHVKKTRRPVVVFFDEIDVIATRRAHGLGVGQDISIVGELLYQLDGKLDNRGLIVIGATNYTHSLDAAVIRPGRLGNIFSIMSIHDMADIAHKVWYDNIKRHPNFLAYTIKYPMVLGLLAELSGFIMPNFYYNKTPLLTTPASISSIVKQLEYSLTMQPDMSIDSVVRRVSIKALNSLGFRTTKVISGKKRGADIFRTSVHEAGHALLSLLFGAEVIFVTNIAAEDYKGITLVDLDNNTRWSGNMEDYLQRILIYMGGHIAERIVTHSGSLGHVGDAQGVTHFVHHIIILNNQFSLLGLKDSGSINNIALLTDAEKIAYSDIKQYLLERLYYKAYKILLKHKKYLLDITNKLMEHQFLLKGDLLALDIPAYTKLISDDTFRLDQLSIYKKKNW